MEYGAYLFILHFWSLADVVEMLSLRFQLLKENKIKSKGKNPIKTKESINQKNKTKKTIFME